MRTAFAFTALLAGLASAEAQTPALGQTPALSKGWTFDETDGASLYAHVCAACHQGDGGGAVGAGSYPALKGDERLASTDYLIGVLLAGQHAMPALGRAMSDAQLADLVNYVRSTFAGADDDPATPERAAAARAALKP
jgi:mono/diheme cytochrome c family protein